MTRSVSSLAIAILLAISTSAQKLPSAEVVMQKVANKLASVKVLGYTYTREFNYPSEEYLSVSKSDGYLELDSPDGLGFRYQFIDDEYIAVYNGSENFIAVKKKKAMVVTNNPTAERMDSAAALYNSPLTLKNALPKLLSNKNIVKTLSRDSQGRYVVEFTLVNASISGLGEIRDLRGERTSIYHVTIDPKTFLPLEVLVTNNKNKDFMKTTFANLTERPKAPSAESWYFSSYTNEYKLERPDEKKLVEVGKTPPAFLLKQFESASKSSLESYRGKVVLLEFWIVQCGFCIAAVPKLNEIAKNFRDADFELVSINIHDAEKSIASFKRRNNLEYTILVDGEKTGDEYGVGAYPALVLIGKDGKIAYSSLGLSEGELITAIKASLER